MDRSGIFPRVADLRCVLFRFAWAELLDTCTTTLHTLPQSLRPRRFTATHFSSPKKNIFYCTEMQH
jgi:hypothetical protein